MISASTWWRHDQDAPRKLDDIYSLYLNFASSIIFSTRNNQDFIDFHISSTTNFFHFFFSIYNGNTNLDENWTSLQLKLSNQPLGVFIAPEMHYVRILKKTNSSVITHFHLLISFYFPVWFQSQNSTK